MSRLSLTWQNYSLGIAVGFGIYAALDLVLLELRAHLPRRNRHGLVLMRSAAYDLAVVIWTSYFFRPQSLKPVENLPGTDVANWNDALSALVDKWYRR